MNGAHILNRKFIGVDLESKYLDLSIKRFENLIRNMVKTRSQRSLKIWENDGNS